MATAPHGVSSEVGPLATVMLHRPGSELRRLTPRNNDELLFDGVPWVSRAQQEHDAFADALRARGVEVLYVRDLLEETLEVPAAREQLLAAALDPQWIGPTLAAALGERLGALGGGELAEVLIAGIAREELRRGLRRARRADGRAAGLPRAPAPEPAVHARLERVAARRRGGHGARDGRAPPRDLDHGRDLRAPPALRRHAAALRRRPGARRVARGRRRARARAGRAGRGGRPAHQPGGRRGVRPAAVRGGGGAHRARGPDRAGPRHDAPRHRLHDGPPRRGRHVPAAGGLAGGLRAGGGRRLRPRRRSSRPRPRRWRSPSCA